MGEAAPLTEDELAAIEARCARADDMVERLCRGRFEVGHRDWLMSIPARPDHDPDLVIAAALVDVPALVAEVRRVWAFCDSLRPLVAEVGRLRAVEAAARVVVADDHQMRSVYWHWEALYEALGVPRGTEAERWAAGQAGRASTFDKGT